MSEMKRNWMAAFEPGIPNALYDQPLAFNPTGEFGSAFGDFRFGRADATGDMTAQFARTVSLGYNYVMLDNPDKVRLGELMDIVTKAHGYGLAVIAKNPLDVNGNPMPYVAHKNVAAVVVEHGQGTPADLADMRSRSWKDNIIPVWFVFDDQAAAQQCVAQIQQGKYKGMGVVCAPASGQKIDRIMILPDV